MHRTPGVQNKTPVEFLTAPYASKQRRTASSSSNESPPSVRPPEWPGHQGRVYLVTTPASWSSPTFSASPIATTDRIYLTDEAGVTIVLAPGDEFRQIPQSDLGTMTLASPAVAGNALFVRTAKKLYRIQQ